MAKNYSLTEAAQIIVENEDAAALVELGKRYPLLVSKLTRIAVKAGEELNDLMAFMPENLSANKINQAIRRSLEEGDPEDADDEDVDADDTDDDAEEEKSKSKGGNGKKPAPKRDSDDVDAGDADYENWNNAKMYKLLGEMGARKDCKEKFGSLSHDAMLKYLKKYGPKAGSAADDVDDETDDAEDDVQDYSGMSAVELYKLCKERKIKAEPKKPAKFYIGLLEKADAEAAAEKARDAADDEDWDEGDGEDWDEEEEPKAKAKPENKKPAAKDKGKKQAAKKAEADDDEDWDI